MHPLRFGARKKYATNRQSNPIPRQSTHMMGDNTVQRILIKFGRMVHRLAHCLSMSIVDFISNVIIFVWFQKVSIVEM